MKTYFTLIALGLIVVSGCDRFSVQKQLELYVAEQKESSPFPRQMSQQLSQVDIQAGDRELIQIFELKGPQSEIKKQFKDLENQVIVRLKKRKNELANLIQYQIVMTFRYRHASSGDLLFEFQVKPWEQLD